MEKTIKIGIAGARGLSTLMGLRASENVEVTAVCDLDEDRLNKCADQAGVQKKYRVFDDMLDKAGIEAVIIGTPMQCHVPQAIAAMEAGIHVMSEVTAGVTMDELFWLCETVEKYKRIYMYAENYIYTPEVQLVKNMVAKGLFGEPYYAEGMYLHNISNLFVYPNGKTSWRSFWQCGKRGNFYPTHSVGPVMQWFPDDRITEISTFSPGVYNDLGLKQDSGTTTMCRTEKGKLLEIRVDCTSPRPHCMTQYQLQGTNGIFQSATYGTQPNGVVGDRARISLLGEESPLHHMQWKHLEDYNDYLPDRYKNATEEQLRAGHGGGDFFIVKDFIDAIRANKQPELSVYKACEWTAVGLLSELSVTNHSRTIEMPHFRPSMPLEEKRVPLND